MLVSVSVGLIRRPSNLRTNCYYVSMVWMRAKLPAFEELAATASPVTVVRQSGYGFGHLVKLGDSLQLVNHVVTGPNSELGPLQVGERLSLILDIRKCKFR